MIFLRQTSLQFEVYCLIQLDYLCINNGFMKKIALALATQISCVAYAQTVSFGNFKVAEQEIIYQKVFQQDSITVPSLEKFYKIVTVVSGITAAPDGLPFNLTHLTI